MPQRPARPCSAPACPNLTHDRYCPGCAARMRPAVTVVCGPPGSGKTSYVREHLQAGDLVLDLDPIKQALTMTDWYAAPDSALPFALAARDAVIRRLERASEIRAWIIGGYPKRRQRQDLVDRLGAEVVILAVPAEECMRRIRADERRPHTAMAMWERLVAKWWREHEPD